jgi:deoxyribodipyrimidine photo-lyase
LGSPRGPAALVWFRRDLRLEDNPALAAAVASGCAVIPVYILDPAADGDWRPGGASRWWLHRSLAALGAALRGRGSDLVLRRDGSAAALRALAAETGARLLFWNREYEPAAVSRDRAVQRELADAPVEIVRFNGSLLFEPDEVANGSGGPFRVFTPFWRRCLALPVAPPGPPLPAGWAGPGRWPSSLALPELGLDPRIDWAGGLASEWKPGEAGALERLAAFAAGGLAGYAQGRDRPGESGTSRLSPHLHFGEVGIRRVWQAIAMRGGRGPDVFRSEIGWREFAIHLLHHFPHTPLEPLRPEFAAFPWKTDPAALRAWQRGQTGYPIVDAGMRQLWRTGWMHNRVRMIAASFLVKDLLLPWTAGAAWFWDTLVDADLAANTLGWQWSAGCGADAAPYFRIFNPVLQGRRFDPDGAYVRRWVPELARLAADRIHEPWTASPEALGRAGVALGENYPGPIVAHAAARKAALDAFAKIRRSEKQGFSGGGTDSGMDF